MKVMFKRIITLAAVAVLGISLSSCTGTSKTSTASSNSKDGGSENSSQIDTNKKYDNDTTPFTIATQTPDGVFNPFFGSSAYDMDITGNTQLSMLGTDANGNIAVGEDQPTVCLDYSVEMPDPSISESDKDNYKTTYRFLIKNDLKFSDGKPLTIDDVLFNLYVYLDPVYSGNTTIYSTDIRGLDAYRTQNPDSTGDTSSLTSTFNSEAQTRIDHMIGWCNDQYDLTNQVSADLDTMKKLFREELTTDWNSAQNDISSYEDTYKFEYGWQIFLFNYKYITINSEVVQQLKDAGKPTEVPESISWNNFDDDQYKTWTKDDFINLVFDEMVNNDVEQARKDNIEQILKYYATSQSIYTQFVAEAKSAYFDSLSQASGLKVPNISGITVDTVSSFDGENSAQISGEHDVLQIVINGVDPKAIWNFGFTVAPLHYYSPDLAGEVDRQTNFGVKFGDISWMQKLQSNLVPLGAGPYVATTDNDGTPTKVADFFNSNIVYYKSNPNFLLGEPKIKHLRYKVVSSTKLLDALENKEIDYADPSATPANLTRIQNKDFLGYALPENNGYGYIGINASKVPDIEVRRAIMHAMDTSLVLDYYTSSMASLIYRSMSTVSWAYPDDLTSPYYAYWGDQANRQKIIDLVESAGYSRSGDGVYSKTVNGGTRTLKYTFTLAGESQDHPAYPVFKLASDVLNSIGFDITVKNDPNALSKLASGGLTIWAAAWGSSIDPDMYQVYHKDSTASSVLNWGYPYLIQNGTNEEHDILDDLAMYIDAGRRTIIQKDRKAYYSKALDDVMKLAIELPTYQRKNLFSYNIEKINSKTLQQEVNAYNGPLSRIWEVEFN